MRKAAPILICFALILAAMAIVIPGMFNKSSGSDNKNAIADACYYAKDVETFWGIPNIAQADLATNRNMRAGAAGLQFTIGDPPRVPADLRPTFTRFFKYLNGKGSQTQGLLDAKAIQQYLLTCHPSHG